MLTDEAPSDTVADRCLRTDSDPPPPPRLSGRAKLAVKLALKWHALRTKLNKKLGKPPPAYPRAATLGMPRRPLAMGDRVVHATLGKGTVCSTFGEATKHPLYPDGTPLVVLVEFDDGATESFKQPAWATLTLVVTDPVKARGLSRGLRLEHPKHGLGVLQSLQGATAGHQLYADGTPLKIKVAFDDGQTREYKPPSWHELRVVPPQEKGSKPGEAHQRRVSGALGRLSGSEGSEGAPKATGLQAIAPAMVVGARVEHSKHGLGVVQHIFGAELDPKHVKVKVAFDNGQTQEFKGAALEKLLVGGELSVTNPNPNSNPNPNPDPNPNPHPNPKQELIKLMTDRAEAERTI